MGSYIISCIVEREFHFKNSSFILKTDACMIFIADISSGKVQLLIYVGPWLTIGCKL